MIVVFDTNITHRLWAGLDKSYFEIPQSNRFVICECQIVSKYYVDEDRTIQAKYSCSA